MAPCARLVSFNVKASALVFVLQVVELARTAYENTTAPEIKAESCYLKARVHHAMGNLSEAKLLYNEACHLWPQFPLAQYGMAQMLVNEGNIEPAVKALDAVLAEVPDNQVQRVVRLQFSKKWPAHFWVAANVVPVLYAD